MSTKTKQLTQEDLNKFSGTEQWYRHGLMRNILYTDGVKYMAETAGAYWLIDEIATGQMLRQVRAEEFQVWTLTVDLEKSSAVLTCDDGNGNIVYTKAIEFTDFPLPTISIWLENNVMMLPGER